MMTSPRQSPTTWAISKISRQWTNFPWKMKTRLVKLLRDRITTISLREMANFHNLSNHPLNSKKWRERFRKNVLRKFRHPCKANLAPVVKFLTASRTLWAPLIRLSPNRILITRIRPTTIFNRKTWTKKIRLELTSSHQELLIWHTIRSPSTNGDQFWKYMIGCPRKQSSKIKRCWESGKWKSWTTTWDMCTIDVSSTWMCLESCKPMAKLSKWRWIPRIWPRIRTFGKRSRKFSKERSSICDNWKTWNRLIITKSSRKPTIWKW